MSSDTKESKSDTKESKKVCPQCHKQYPEEDRYCGDDGAHLETIDSSNRSPEGDQEPDVVQDAQTVSGRRGNN